MTDARFTVNSMIESLATFPSNLPIVVEGPVNQDGRAEIEDIMVAMHNGAEEVHLITKR